MVDPVERLILELKRLPGLGERSATRLAFHIIHQSRQDGRASLAHDLAAALTAAAEKVGLCPECHNLSSSGRCALCQDARRDTTLLCVVESVQDLRAVESTGAYRGLYHVLHGALAPLDGVGPAELKLAGLSERVRRGVSEVILATNADVDGDATALYLAQLLAPLSVRVTRLAAGIPLGGELEYIDRATLGRALSERRTF